MTHKRANLSIHLPLIHPEAKKIAQDLANAPFVFEVNGKQEEYTVAEVTDGLISDSASQMIDTKTKTELHTALMNLMCSTLEAVRDAQILARHYLELGIQLDETSKQMHQMQSIVVDKMDVTRTEDRT